MNEHRRDDGQRIEYLHPRRVLLWANMLAATACFGQATLWIIAGYLGPSFFYVVSLLALGGVLSLIAFVGSWLERR